MLILPQNRSGPMLITLGETVVLGPVVPAFSLNFLVTFCVFTILPQDCSWVKSAVPWVPPSPLL